VANLVFILSLGDVLVSNFDFWRKQRLQQVGTIHSQKERNLFSIYANTTEHFYTSVQHAALLNQSEKLPMFRTAVFQETNSSETLIEGRIAGGDIEQHKLGVKSLNNGPAELFTAMKRPHSTMWRPGCRQIGYS
jgi:hypothetical protein